MEKGFDEGVRLMKHATAEILERGDDAVDDVLSSSTSITAK